jgi:hypothetical protein
MEGNSGMSLLSDLLGGGSSGGGGGGVPLGGLIETGSKMPSLDGYLKADQTQILPQTGNEDLYAALGLIADDGPEFSVAANSTSDQDGNTIEDVNHAAQVYTSLGSIQNAAIDGFVKASDTLYFYRWSNRLMISTTGPLGPYTEETSFQTDVGESAPTNYKNLSMCWGNGYLVLMGSQKVCVNQVAHDYTSWTEYDMDTNANRRIRGVTFINGWFFCTYVNNWSGGTGYTAWTQDPRFESNWTKQQMGFNFQTENVASNSNNRHDVYYFPNADKFVVVYGCNYRAADRHFFEVWYMTDPATETFTENTDVSSLYSYVTSSDNNLWMGIPFEQGSKICIPMEFQGGPYAAVFDDITTFPVTFDGVENTLIAGMSLQMNRYPFMTTADGDPLPQGGGVTFLHMSQYYLMNMWLEGNILKHSRCQVFDSIFNNEQGGFSSDGQMSTAWRWMIYDEDTRAMTTIGRPDSGNYDQHWVWQFPFFSYNLSTEFAIPKAKHLNKAVIYQTRTE